MVKKSIQQAGQLFLDLFRIPTSGGGETGKKTGVAGKRQDDLLTERAANLLIDAGAAGVARRVKVLWNSRLTTTAGLARYRESMVVLNPRLQAFDNDEVDRTLRHELAHLLAHSRAGRKRISPHGAEWKKACLDLGLNDEKRCHELPLPRRMVARKHFYACIHCRAVVPRVRPIRRRVACLQCCRTYNRGAFDAKYLLKKLS